LRITSGIKKGASLFSSNDLSIRPTTDKVKQSIFNTIQFEIKDREVLDLFSGSGSLGIEAISRGAKSCTFVDKDPTITKKNIDKLQFQENSSIIKADFCDFLSKCNQKFSLVFLDPPYNKGYIDTSLKLLVCNNLLLGNAIIVMECDAIETLKIPDSIQIIKSTKYGRIQVIIGRYL
jgi:16S rRNA (guanine(966)-N(2))-methyltransferase RsmD